MNTANITDLKTALIALTANKLHNTFYAKNLLIALKYNVFSKSFIANANSVSNSAITKHNLLQYVHCYYKLINKLTFSSNKQVKCTYLLQLNAQFCSAVNAQQITQAISIYIAMHKQALKNTKNKKIVAKLKAIF
jgi:hypothetical protein